MRQAFFRTTVVDIRTLEWTFVVGERDWVQLCIQQVKAGIYSQGVERGLVDRKLLRGKIKVKENLG